MSKIKFLYALGADCAVSFDEVKKIAADNEVETEILDSAEQLQTILKANNESSSDEECVVVLTEKEDRLKGMEKAVDERLQKILITVGIPSHIKGSKFLRDAVKAAITTPDMINNITKMLYPAIAEKNNTTPSKVERAIRHAIEVSWNRGKIENINSIFGIKVFSRGEKPTNGELIALIADRILIEIA